MSAAGSGYWLPDLGSEPLPVPHTEDVEKEPENSRREPEKLQLCSVCAFAFCRKCEGTSCLIMINPTSPRIANAR